MFTSRHACGCYTKVYRAGAKQVSSVRDLCYRHCSMELDDLVCEHVQFDYMAHRTGISTDTLESILQCDPYNAELLHHGGGRICKSRVDKFDMSILSDLQASLGQN